MQADWYSGCGQFWSGEMHSVRESFMLQASLAMVSVLIVCLSAVGHCQEPVAPQPPEQTVMVISPEAVLKSGSDVVGKSRLGDLLKGREVNGEWLWIPAAKGWIQQKHILPVDEAVSHFTKAIENDPSAQAYFQRATARLALGQSAEAVTDLTRVIELDPNNVLALNERGTTWRQLGKLAEAKADFDAVIASGVRHPAVLTNRALVQMDQGTTESVEGALADLRAALQIDSRFAPAWEASAQIRERAGVYDKALEYYAMAARLDPAFVLAWNNRAWLLATAPDAEYRNGPLAVQCATKACELTGYQAADMLDTLAAALAEAGQFKQAVTRARQALEKADAGQQASQSARLKLYESGKPYHQPRR